MSAAGGFAVPVRVLGRKKVWWEILDDQGIRSKMCCFTNVTYHGGWKNFKPPPQNSSWYRFLKVLFKISEEYPHPSLSFYRTNMGPRLVFKRINATGLKVNKYHGKHTRKYISHNLYHREVEKVNGLIFLDCKVYVFNNCQKLSWIKTVTRKWSIETRGVFLIAKDLEDIDITTESRLRVFTPSQLFWDGKSCFFP